MTSRRIGSSLVVVILILFGLAVPAAAADHVPFTATGTAVATNTPTPTNTLTNTPTPTNTPTNMGFLSPTANAAVTIRASNNNGF